MQEVKYKTTEIRWITDHFHIWREKIKLIDAETFL